MMQSLKSPAFRSGALLFLCTVILLLHGCTGLRPLTERTITLEAEKAASIFGENHHDTFGICDPFFLDRRGTRLYLWDEFVRQRDSADSESHISHLAGYEVTVTRGESCHLRIFETYQAAVKFDLTALPADAAVVSAQLNIHGSFAPLDPPRDRGNRVQCTIMLLGQATEPWEAGIFRNGLPDGSRAFIPARSARPATGPFYVSGSTAGFRFDVTQTVSEWVRGIRTNHGFVITPDRESLMDFYNATDEGGYFCDTGISRFELVVTIAVPQT